MTKENMAFRKYPALHVLETHHGYNCILQEHNVWMITTDDICSSSLLLCGCYVIECIIFQIKPCNLCPVGIKYR